MNDINNIDRKDSPHNWYANKQASHKPVRQNPIHCVAPTSEHGPKAVIEAVDKLDDVVSKERASLKPAKEAYVHDPKVTNKMMKKVADRVHKLPTMSAKDKAKTKQIVLAIRSARSTASHHAANSLRHAHVKSSGWQKIDPIASLANAIDKFSRLNVRVLTGGSKLKVELIRLAWAAYADLEINGFDNAHYIESQIPMDERQEIADDGCNVGTGFNNEEYVEAYRYMHDDSTGAWNLSVSQGEG